MLAAHIFANVSAETTSVDSDQTSPVGPVHSESTLFDQKAGHQLLWQDNQRNRTTK